MKKRSLSILLCISLLVSFLWMPCFSLPVKAANMDEISLTSSQLLSVTSESTFMGEFVQYLYFGEINENGQTRKRKWLIIGAAENENCIYLLPTEPIGLKHKFAEHVWSEGTISKLAKYKPYQKEWGCVYEDGSEPTFVNINHYGGSMMREYVGSLLSEFNSIEQSLMKPATYWTWDSYNNKAYQTTDKLFLPSLYEDEYGIQRLSVGVGTAQSPNYGSEINLYMQQNFTRTPNINTLHDTTNYADHVYSWDSIDGRPTLVTDALPVYPICKLDLSNVVLAAAMNGGDTSSSIPVEEAKILRLDDSFAAEPHMTDVRTSLSEDGKSIQVSGIHYPVTPEQVFVIADIYACVQTTQHGKLEQFTSTTLQSDSSTLTVNNFRGMPPDTDFRKCNIWLEYMRDGFAYAVPVHIPSTKVPLHQFATREELQTKFDALSETEDKIHGIIQFGREQKWHIVGSEDKNTIVLFCGSPFIQQTSTTAWESTYVPQLRQRYGQDYVPNYYPKENGAYFTEGTPQQAGHTDYCISNCRTTLNDVLHDTWFFTEAEQKLILPSRIYDGTKYYVEDRFYIPACYPGREAEGFLYVGEGTPTENGWAGNLRIDGKASGYKFPEYCSWTLIPIWLRSPNAQTSYIPDIPNENSHIRVDDMLFVIVKPAIIDGGWTFDNTKEYPRRNPPPTAGAMPACKMNIRDVAFASSYVKVDANTYENRGDFYLRFDDQSRKVPMMGNAWIELSADRKDVILHDLELHHETSIVVQKANYANGRTLTPEDIKAGKISALELGAGERFEECKIWLETKDWDERKLYTTNYLDVGKYAKINFKINNGTWEDTGSAVKTVDVEMKNGKGTLDAGCIPVPVPNRNYGGGRWDTVPNTGKDQITRNFTYIYTYDKQPGYTVDVTGGVAKNSAGTVITGAMAGDTVTVTATPKEGQEFITWQTSPAGVVFADASSKTTTFTMPDSKAIVQAVYWNAPTYEWKQQEGTYTCRASRSRTDGGTPLTADAVMTQTVVKDPTETTLGTTAYTATFSVPWAVTQNKTLEDIPMLDPARMKIVIEEKSITFGSTFHMNFKVNIGAVPENSIEFLVWTTPQKDYVKGTENKIIPVSRHDESGRTVYSYQDLDARQMADVIYVRAYAKIGNNTIYSDPVRCSITEYAHVLKTMPEHSALYPLIDKMLEYGAEAQRHYHYHEDTLATEPVYKVKLMDAKFDDGLSIGYFKKGEVVTITAVSFNPDVSFINFKNERGEEVGNTPVIQYTVTEDTDIGATFFQISSS